MAFSHGLSRKRIEGLGLGSVLTDIENANVATGLCGSLSSDLGSMVTPKLIVKSG